MGAYNPLADEPEITKETRRQEHRRALELSQSQERSDSDCIAIAMEVHAFLVDCLHEVL